MPVVNLADDWNKFFGNRPVPKSTSVPEPEKTEQPRKRVSKKPIEVYEEEDELDIVIDKKPVPKKKTKITEEDWQMSAELSNDPECNITTRPRVTRKKAPSIMGNKTYISNGTALWGQVRKNAYPMYAQFCKDNNYIPNIADYTKLISATWKTLSNEDKIRAATNPSEFFVFE